MEGCSQILIARPGFAGDLADELADWAGSKKGVHILAPSLVGVAADPPPSPLVFERGRWMQPAWIPATDLRPVRRETLLKVFGEDGPDGPFGIRHADTGSADEKAGRRSRGIARDLVRTAKRERFPWAGLVREKNQKRGSVLHLALLPEGLFCGWTRFDEERSYRMKDDPEAPSRSFMKVEEAWSRMGESPQPGQRVVDLGAAPGGWSYACLKRGAHVTAVDRGPMKIPSLGSLPGELFQRLEDGLTFTPDNPAVDWLLGDMLVPPGPAQGLLRRWLENRWARRIVLNVKIPQQQAWSAIKPLVESLNSMAPNLNVRHLYHDRREVTVFGRL